MRFNREMRDYVRKLLLTSIALNEISKYQELSYQKSVEIRKQHEEAYKKWLFYKNLQAELNKQTNRRWNNDKRNKI